MRFFLVIIFIMFIATACDIDTSSVDNYKDEQTSSFETLKNEIYQGYRLNILRDKETGCQYFVQQNHMEPRMGSDGKQICK